AARRRAFPLQWRRTAAMTLPALSFGPFVLDPASGTLTRDGAPVPMTPRALQVLEYLARRPGRLVPHAELLRAAWPDTHVGDGALKVCIREIRRALEDDARQPVYVETAYRRGYRFIARVTPRTGMPESPAVDTVGIPPVRY